MKLHPRHVLTALSALVLPLVAGACTWETDLPAGARSIEVRSDRELLVTDEAVVTGPLAKNREHGPLSFRHAMSALPIDGAATLRWMTTLDANVACRWLRAAPSNQCDDTCASCTQRELDLGEAPFRLLAVANRTDLATMPDRAADGGEGRFVFGLTEGPADDASSASLPYTVIFEYAQQGTTLSWARRWHSLGTASDADFPARLTELTEAFVATGALAQIRTADALHGPMVLHQFQLASGDVVASSVRNTPDWQRVPVAALRDYADAHGAAISDGTAVLPKEWWARSSALAEQPPSYVAELPQHDGLVRGTCGGCHAQSERGFHIDPLANGEKKLSRFLVDPSKGEDELRRRAQWMQLTLFAGQ
jgi:hypothetical protein